MATLNHKTDIQWPVIFLQNKDTGRITAILKGVNGVVAQGEDRRDALVNLTECLKVMSEVHELVQTPDTAKIDKGYNVSAGKISLSITE